MKKFLIGLVTGLLLAGVTLLVVVFAAMRLGERRPAVDAGSTLMVRLEGTIPELPPMTMPFPILESDSRGHMLEVWSALRRAASDERIRAVVLMPDSLAVGWAKLDELRTRILELQKAGKHVIAWLRTPGSREYYLASAADKIYTAPEDYLDVKGFRAELLFLRGTLDKLGVQMEIEHAGRYKDAGDMFTRTSMSPETREVLNSVLDQVSGRFTAAVAASRNRSPDQVRALLDEGPFLAPQAKAKGLVDDLLYEDQVFDKLKERLKQNELKKISLRDYARTAPVGPAPKRRVAIIVGEGSILRGGGGGGLGSEEAILSEPFVRTLRQVASDASIKGAILRIDSPGGDAMASDDILREVKLLGKKKPLVISMSDVAASGGYYIAMSGDPVVAYPETITGSIGVIFGKLTLRGLYDKLGMSKDLLTRGRYAAIDSDYQPLGADGRKKLREAIDSVYQGFLARVAEGRKRKIEEIAPLAEGRVWMGAQARQRGLVDELGGLDRALELLKQKARIPKDEKVRLIIYPPQRSLLDRLLSRHGETAIDRPLRSLLSGFDLRPWLQGGLLRIMPYTVAIR